MNEPFDSKGGRELRRNRLFMGLAITPFLLSLSAVVAGIVASPKFFVGVFHPFILGVVALAYVWKRNPRPVMVPAPVRADEAGVRIGERLVPRAEIREAFVIPAVRDNPTRVQLVRKGLRLPIELVVDDADQGRQLLRAIGFDASQTVATFSVISRALAHDRAGFAITSSIVAAGFGVGLVAGLARTHPTLAGVSVLAAAMAIITGIAAMIAPTKLRVGADGIAMSWLGRKRFIGYADIELVTHFEKRWGRTTLLGLDLLLRSGELLHVPIDQSGWPGGRAPIIQERIREAMETFREGDTAADAALLRRGERSVAAWVVELRSIGAGANAGPRTAPIPRERLFRVVEDPRASHSARAAAAIALGADINASDRARLRIAADAVAAPKLRVAIEAAAKSEDDADAALAEIEATATDAGHARAARSV